MYMYIVCTYNIDIKEQWDYAWMPLLFATRADGRLRYGKTGASAWLRSVSIISIFEFSIRISIEFSIAGRGDGRRPTPGLHNKISA